jgi:hypothetical protein
VPDPENRVGDQDNKSTGRYEHDVSKENNIFICKRKKVLARTP